MGGPIDVDVYAGDVQLDGIGGFPGLVLCQLAAVNPNPEYHAILGRDILNGGMAWIDGRTKEVTLDL